MATPAIGNPAMRAELEVRRDRLQAVLSRSGPNASLETLLSEVDAALERVAKGKFGICEECHDAIEPGRLAADPLIRFCVDHLTPGEKAALQQDLELAYRIQRGLLPPSDVVTSGWKVHYSYQPFGPVSGDYCDLIQPGGQGGDLYFLLGDVSGKGVAASMLMSHLSAMFRSLTGLGITLPEMMSRACRLFSESSIPGQFATLVCGRGTPGGEVEICNAGHLPVLLVSDGRVSKLESSGFPLGMFTSASYAPQKSLLAEGDTLVLYTDGITESRNPSGQEYGLERMAHIAGEFPELAPHALIAACLRDVETHRNGAPRTDDLTVMVIRRAA